MTWLVADIGTSNAHFGIVETPGAAPSRVAVLACRDHAGLSAAAATYLARYAGEPRPTGGCVVVAGPTDGERFGLRDAGWSGTAAQVREDLRLDRLELLGGVHALALALPLLGPGDVRVIGAARPRGGLPMAVLDPGVGLGVAGIVPGPGGWAPVTTEAGQVDLPAGTAREAELLRSLRDEHGVSSAESLLSDAGLVRLHELLARLHGVPADRRTAAEICARRTDPLCAEALNVFCGLLGAFAGNVALTLGARGGVHLGGTLVPRIADVLRRSDFRRRFEGGPPMQAHLAEVPTVLIVAPDPGLTGAAAWLRRHRATEELVERV